MTFLISSHFRSLRDRAMPDAPGKLPLAPLDAVSRADAAEPEPFEAWFASPAASGSLMLVNQATRDAQQFGVHR